MRDLGSEEVLFPLVYLYYFAVHECSCCQIVFASCSDFSQSILFGGEMKYLSTFRFESSHDVWLVCVRTRIAAYSYGNAIGLDWREESYRIEYHRLFG